MRAIVSTIYGPPDVMRLSELAQPAPQDHEVLVKVHAASVNAADWHMLRGEPRLMRLSMGLRRPRHTVLGADVAGTVVAVGGRVTQLRVGDAVYGDLSAYRWGGFAEYVCAPETALTHKPAALSFEQAAAVPMAACTALQALRDSGGLRAGEQVLINGASGGVGTYAVQIAKALGATVTAVCSPRNVEQARSLGADHVIDYTREDFAAGGARFDLIMAANGSRPLSDYLRALRPGGRYVMAGGSNRQIFESLLRGPLVSLRGRASVRSVLAQPSQRDLQFLGELLADGRVKPVIERRFALEAVPEALRYVEAGHARGKVVISVDAAAAASA